MKISLHNVDENSRTLPQLDTRVKEGSIDVLGYQYDRL